MKLCGIYCIENTVNNKKYIGLSRDIERRWIEHRSALNRGDHINQYLQSAWNLYGEDAFAFYAVELCEPKDLSNRECYYINEYHTLSHDNGYNLTTGGENTSKGKCVICLSNNKIYTTVKEAAKDNGVADITMIAWCRKRYKFMYLDEYNEENSDSFVWQLRRNSSGVEYFQVYSPAHGKALDVALAGTRVPLFWDPNYTNTNQQIYFIAAGNEPGVYQLSAVYKNVRYYLEASGNGLVMTTSPTVAGSYFRLSTVDADIVPLGNVWENETFFEQNKEPGHATYMPYSSAASMRADDKYNYPWLEPQSADYISLNGTWKLNWVTSPDQRPGKDTFWGDEADVSSWNDIKVPSCLALAKLTFSLTFPLLK